MEFRELNCGINRKFCGDLRDSAAVGYLMQLGRILRLIFLICLVPSLSLLMLSTVSSFVDAVNSFVDVAAGDVVPVGAEVAAEALHDV